MKTALLLPTASLLLLAPGAEMGTDYTADRTYFLTASTSLEMETTEFSMERDGEPVEGRGGGGGNASLEERTVLQAYRVLEHKDGAPTKVRRVFDTVSRETVSETGEESIEGGGDGPLHGLALVITADGDDVEVEVEDGREPDQESALEGHSLVFAFDGLLPEGEVEEEATWELESDAILSALALDMEDAYFPRAERSDEGGEGGRGGRGRRGGGDRASTLRSLVDAEWEGEATFHGETEHEGIPCFEIALELEAEGELPERTGGERGGRGGRAFATEASLADNTITAEISGRLLVATEGNHPVLLELEGSISTVSTREMGRRDSTMTIYTEREGSFEYTVAIEVQTEDSDEG